LIEAGVPFYSIYKQSDITIEELVREFTEVIRENEASRKRDIQAIEAEANDERGVIVENQPCVRCGKTGNNLAEVGESHRNGSQRGASELLSDELGKVPQKNRKRRNRSAAIPAERMEGKRLLSRAWV